MSEILRESAKFRLIWTGAQQTVGSGLTPDMHRAIIGSSNIKIAGATDNLYWKSEAALFDIEPAQIGTLSPGGFYMRIGNNPPFKFKTYAHLLGNSNAMSETQWARVRAAQLKRYYRPILEEPPRPLVEIIPPESVEKHPGAVRTTRAVEVTDVVLTEDMKPAPWKKILSFHSNHAAPLRTIHPILTVARSPSPDYLSR